MKFSPFKKSFFLFLVFILFSAAAIISQEGTIAFDSSRWQMTNAKTVEFLGKPALQGTAMLNDAEFENGVIEFDLVVSGARSYPGVLFRSQPDGSWERVYIRPHRSGCVPPPLYSDVVQYVAAWHGVDSWQFYNGEGFTAAAMIPLNRWLHVKIEVSGTQARVFLDNAAQPVLQIDKLVHGQRKGGLGLLGPVDGSAYFANFSYRRDDSLKFDPSPLAYPVPGIISVWEISQPFKALQIDMEKTPEEQNLNELAWKAVSAADDGLVDISRFHPRHAEPDAVFARTVIYADEDKVYKLNLGYSDYVSLFLNGRLLYAAASPYGGRDPSFLGVLGFFDSVFLPLKKGANEVLLTLAESSGGWGFKAQDGNAVFTAPAVAKVWETSKQMRIPESAAYDPKTKAIYVSNNDGYNRSLDQGTQFISKISLDGRIEKMEWLSGMRNPTGLAVFQDRLFVVEARSLVEIDIAKAQLLKRIAVPGAMLLNDIAIDPKGTIYVSDFRKGVIFKLAKEKFAEWLSGPEIGRPNGISVSGKKLFWGNCADGKLKVADLASKRITTIANLGQGIIDGVLAEDSEHMLVSQNEGRLFRVSSTGQVSLLLDTTVVGQNLADFTFIPELNLAIIPTWLDNRVTAYSLSANDEK